MFGRTGDTIVLLILAALCACAAVGTIHLVSMPWIPVSFAVLCAIAGTIVIDNILDNPFLRWCFTKTQR